jgi:uncharacterized protein (DUF58 family)
MTRLGRVASVFSIAVAIVGFMLQWESLAVIGGAGLFAVLTGFSFVIGTTRVDISRSVSPKRLPKGQPALAYLTVVNRGLRTLKPLGAVQTFGEEELSAVLPRVAPRRTASRGYELPTAHRGVFSLSPIELRKRDPFGFFSKSQQHGVEEMIWVQPAALPLRPIASGRMRSLDGPTSDLAPQGSMAFHRIREYVPGDDRRMIHWKSTARAAWVSGSPRYMVRHNVDTTQPMTMVLIDLRPSRYSADGFESMVDLASSTSHVAVQMRSHLHLKTTANDFREIPAGNLDSTAVVDFLTEVKPLEQGELRISLLELGSSKTGSTLIVCCGVLQEDELAAVASLQKRFGKVIVARVSPDLIDNPFSTVTLLQGADAAAVSDQWNAEVAR